MYDLIENTVNHVRDDFIRIHNVKCLIKDGWLKISQGPTGMSKVLRRDCANSSRLLCTSYC